MPAIVVLMARRKTPQTYVCASIQRVLTVADAIGPMRMQTPLHVIFERCMRNISNAAQRSLRICNLPHALVAELEPTVSDSRHRVKLPSMLPWSRAGISSMCMGRHRCNRDQTDCQYLSPRTRALLPRTPSCSVLCVHDLRSCATFHIQPLSA